MNWRHSNRMLRSSLVAFSLGVLACGPPPSRLGVSPEVVAFTKGTLDMSEDAVMRTRGFVVTRKSAPSFHVGYTSLFREHQPMYVTADAVLEAWHASFSSIFAELEAGALAPALTGLVGELRKNLAASKPAKGREQAHKDIDVFLGVAASLLAGGIQEPVAGGDREAIEEIARRVHAGVGEGGFELFGQRIEYDFVAGKPRGHYASNTELQRYFRTLTWLRQIEIRIASDDTGKWVVDRRALDAADTLRVLFRGEAERHWREIDGVMTLRGGPSNSLSLQGFDAAMKKLGAISLAKASDKVLAAAFVPEAAPRVLPQLDTQSTRYLGFRVFGPRVRFDELVLAATGTVKTRLMPRPLDVAATVWSNPSARRMLEPDVTMHGAELKGVYDWMRDKADTVGPEVWQNSMHHRWLRVLRELSPNKVRDAKLAAPLTSDAWSVRLLNTQMASWAELRHDQIPLAKPAERGVSVCEYPAGYVEPYPAFFSAMEELARGGRVSFEQIPLKTPVKQKAMDFFDRFAGTMGVLRGMAEKERDNLPFNEQDLDFFNRMVSIDGKTAGCSLQLEPGGWYGNLYYDRTEAIWGAPVITDVFTQPTDADGTTVGKVLHVGTADPRMFVVTIQHACNPPKQAQKCPQTYRGFVSSYVERSTDGFARVDDKAWSEYLLRGGDVPIPKWMKSIMPE